MTQSELIKKWRARAEELWKQWEDSLGEERHHLAVEANTLEKCADELSAMIYG